MGGVDFKNLLYCNIQENPLLRVLLGRQYHDNVEKKVTCISSLPKYALCKFQDDPSKPVGEVNYTRFLYSRI